MNGSRGDGFCLRGVAEEGVMAILEGAADGVLGARRLAWLGLQVSDKF